MDYSSNLKKQQECYEEKRACVDFYPRSMNIEVTSFCNYECKMCPHALLKNKIAKHLDMRVIEALEPYFKYCSDVSLQGDGEPFMNPDIHKIVKVLKLHDVKLSTTTNLSIFDDRIAKLVSENFNMITVSCDACDKEVYESIRKNGDYINFCKNLDMLVRSARNTKIALNCVLMRQNIHLAEKMIDFAKTHGVDKVMFSNLLTDVDLKTESDSLEGITKTAYYHIDSAERRARELGIELVIGWDYSSNVEDDEKEVTCEPVIKRLFTENEIEEFRKRYERSKVVNTKVCDSGKYKCKGMCSNIFDRIYVDAKGNLSVCCFSKMNPIGNVTETPFEEIWNGYVYKKYRQDFFDGKLPDFCIGCKYALSIVNGQKQSWPFKIINIDSEFSSNLSFWNNR